MTTTAELLSIFEDQAKGQRLQASRIEALRAAEGIPLGDLAVTVTYLRQQADVCDAAAQAIRDGEAHSIDDIASGGIAGPFNDASGNPL